MPLVLTQTSQKEHLDAKVILTRFAEIRHLYKTERYVVEFAPNFVNFSWKLGYQLLSHLGVKAFNNLPKSFLND